VYSPKPPDKALSGIQPGILAFREGQDMGRRRLQQKGDLYQQGGWWKLRWREDQLLRDGSTKYGWSKPVWIGPANGRGRMTEKEAKRTAWENFLSRLDKNMRTPQTVMTVREFVELKFEPEHVAMLKPGGRLHYSTHLQIVLDGIPGLKLRSRKKPRPGDLPTPPVKRIAGIGDMRLRDVSTEDCQRLISSALERGYSVQYATHIRNCISAIFSHAESKDWFSERNPAKRVKLPEMVRREAHALTFDQVMRLVAALDLMTRAIVLCAVLTSMNIAEVLGLRWKYVNISNVWATVDGESLPPWQIAVRWQWTLRQFGSVKAKKRRRQVVIPALLADALAALRKRDRFTDPEDAVFASRSGRPVDEKNIMRRRLRKAATALGMPWIGWHDLRRTFSTLADQAGMTAGERQATMGHADARMTARYTITPSEQARAAVERMAALISGTSGKVN
jgi:integrase